MKKISKILLENALERDQIRSIKGGSLGKGCITVFDCEAWEKCCTGPGGGSGTCKRFC